ncbi:MAG: metalloregulator ArsR/SmtB family transcription factor [Pseudomonadota bacterium]
MTYGNAIAALADPTRRVVLEKVARAPTSVTALAATLPVSRPAVSQHLRVLSDAGLVAVTAKGTRRIYTLRREGLADLRAYLDQFWTDVLTEFAEEVERLETKSHDRPDH